MYSQYGFISMAYYTLRVGHVTGTFTKFTNTGRTTTKMFVSV